MPIDTWYEDYVSPDGNPSTWTSSTVIKHGKALACTQLERFGLDIIGQDYSLSGDDEQNIDIVATNGYEHILVEVRAIVGGVDDVPPEYEITEARTKTMRETLVSYLKENPDVRVVRYDVISLLIITKDFALVSLLEGVVKLTREDAGL